MQDVVSLVKPLISEADPNISEVEEDWHVRQLKCNLESSGMIKEFKILSDVNRRYFAQVFFIDGSDAVFFVSQFCLYTALRESRNLDRIIPILLSEASIPPMVFTVERGSSRQLSFIDGISVPAYRAQPPDYLVHEIREPMHVLTPHSADFAIDTSCDMTDLIHLYENFPKPVKKIHSAKEALKEYGKCIPRGMQGLAANYDNCLECGWYSWMFYEKKADHIIAIENDEDFEIMKNNFVEHMNEAHPDICARKIKLQDAAKYT